MEDVLEVYTRPYDERRPQLNLDEGSKQLVSELCEALPMEPGKPRRQDYEYERLGFCSPFVVCQALVGQRQVYVREQRTKLDWAYVIRDLVDVVYPHAEKLVLVMDNLNTHSIASLYEAFAPEEAYRLAQKLEIHYTPLHGSWLNLAEIELSVLARQALKGRMASVQEVQERVQAWQDKRNRLARGISWHFTTADARIKLQHLYPRRSDEA